MGAGDIYKKRLKAAADSLGTGTPSETTFLRGDGAWETPVAASDVSNLENTLAMIAWDTYSTDQEFDDIYIDNFTTDDGIDGTVGVDTRLTGNSNGIYDSVNTLFKSGSATGLIQEVTTAQIGCSAWADINSVAITQTTPGDVSASAIYHAVSFDNAVTYKVFKTTWQTVAYNNEGTWQYNNAGSLANASTNSLAGAMEQSTAQSAYQWTKTNIEAMADADWNESGGWSTSVTTIDWATRTVAGVTAETPNSSTTTATAAMTSNSTPNTPYAYMAAADSAGNVAMEAWGAFTRDLATTFWASTGTVCPHWIRYDFGNGNAKHIDKMRYYNMAMFCPKRWKLQATNDATPSTSETTGWTTLIDNTGADVAAVNAEWSAYFYVSHAVSGAYRHYRLYITSATQATGQAEISELELIEANIETATPTFTKATINYDIEDIPLDLRSLGWEASANDPTDAYCVLDVEPVDAITYNTDLLAYASIDDGEHYEQFTLETTPFCEIGDHDYIRGDLSGITARTDKKIRIKTTSANSKALKLHAWAIGVKY